MRVSVIIPTLNPGAALGPLLKALLGQTVAAELLVVDSGSLDGTCDLVKSFAGRVRLLCVPREEFDHGGTRDLALKACSGELVCFLTQDALPLGEDFLEKLLAPFADEQVAGVFGRQLARPEAGEAERLTREFNYPAESSSRSAEDIPRLGVKAFFFSDVCAAYRRSAYLAAGGFDRPVETNEDMLMAARLLRAGFRLAYEAEACVRHSHHFTLAQDFKRSARSGAVMTRYKQLLQGACASREGLRYVKTVLGGLLRRGLFGQAAGFFLHAGARFLGNRWGSLRENRRRAKKEISI